MNRCQTKTKSWIAWVGGAHKCERVTPTVESLNLNHWAGCVESLKEIPIFIYHKVLTVSSTADISWIISEPYSTHLA
jgi:hypothetical protein